MSYPLVQFASDTLAASKNSLGLKVNLMTLLLTALSDVVIFGEIQAISDLFFHHRCLDKCLEISQAELKIQVVPALLRLFRICLEKHANHKALKLKNVDVSQELVRQICHWFSRSQTGLAHYTACLIQETTVKKR